VTVTVKYDPLPAPVHNATVTIAGPVKSSRPTDDSGRTVFTGLPPGTYAISAKYTGKNDLVDLAKSKVDSTNWAFAAERGGFKKDTNKCNLFVFEMTSDAGFSVPQKAHEQKDPLFHHTWNTVMIPPNAGDWASRTSTVGKSTVVATPEPGDIAGWSHPEWTDATGHVAIVSYPKDSPVKSRTLAPGDDAKEDLTMRRQVIGANESKVEEDDSHFWHFYDEHNAAETGKVTFRHMNR
jgi:hypothetical protein